MKELYFWDEINGIGKLYAEIELIVGLEPVLFVCVLGEDKKEKYLIMTYDSYEGVFIMRKIEDDELLDMLQNKVTMEQTFRNGGDIFKTYIDDAGIMQCERHIACDFDGNLLPKKGEYFELHSRHILSYIEELKKIHYNINLVYEDYPCNDVSTEEIDVRNILFERIVDSFFVDFLDCYSYQQDRVLNENVSGALETFSNPAA